MPQAPLWPAELQAAFGKKKHGTVARSHRCKSRPFRYTSLKLR